MPTKIQFAFQGGGARLALLLPVVQAIRECEDEELIAVTRVAGTSAGAIAAGLVAGKADMKALIADLRRLARKEPDKLRAVFPTIGSGFWAKCGIFYRVFVRNKTLSSEDNFAQFLTTCLETAGIQPGIEISAMKIPCTIICADMVGKEHVTVSPNATLLQLMLDSTALPFVFRNGGAKLDGGLIDNLPVDHLAADIDDERILAVGFEEDPYVRPPDSALSLAAALLDVAIGSKTRSTKRILGKNYVLSLSSNAGDGINVTSFDIEGFIKFLASENAYNERVSKAKTWIRSQIDEVEKRRAQIVLVPNVLSRPEEAVKQLRSTFDHIGKLARHYQKHDNIAVIHSALEVIAFSLKDPAKHDMIRFTDQFRVTSGSLNIFVSKFFLSNTAQDMVSARFEVYDQQMRPIDFSVLEVPESGMLAKSCVIIFARPLTAGGPDDVFTIVQEQLAPSVMDPLVKHGADYLSAEVVQSPTAKRVEIALAVPTEFGELSVEDGTVEQLRTLPVHSKEDLAVPLKSGERISRGISGVPANFDIYAWGASDLTRPQQARMIVRKIRN
jgi:predicted acylesterase/phospholipase RssA